METNVTASAHASTRGCVPSAQIAATHALERRTARNLVPSAHSGGCISPDSSQTIPHADTCRWAVSETERDPAQSHFHQLTFLSPLPGASPDLEEAPKTAEHRPAKARAPACRSRLKRITAADIVDFAKPRDPRPQLRSHTGAALAPLYVSAADATDDSAIRPADATTIIQSAEALLAHRLRRGVKIFRDPHLLLRFMQIRLVSQPGQVFAMFLLDRKQQLIHFAELFHGDAGAVKVFPREVVREVIAWNAEQVLCVRSDPGGDHQPTSEDLVSAGRISRAMDLLRTPLVDYLVVGQSFTSLRERRAI